MAHPVEQVGGIRFPQLGFSVARPERTFWQLLPAPVIGGQVYRLPPISTDEWMDKKLLSDEKKKTGAMWPQ